MDRQRGFIRRSVLCAGAVSMLATSGLFTLVAVQPAHAAPAIADFTVFGTNSVHIGFESTVTGLVGSINDRVSPLPNPSEALHLSGGAHIVGSARVVENVNLQNQTGISGTLTYAGSLSQSATGTIGTINHVANAAAVDLPSGPIPTQWATASTFCAANHTPDINNANGTTITLTPGTWGTIHAGGNTTLNFNGAGDYLVDGIDIGSGVTINFTKGMRLFVCSKVQLGKITSTNEAGFVPADVYTEVAGIPAPSDTNGFEVDTGPWVGDIVTPTSGIHYGSGGSGSSSIVGHIWGEHIDLEHSVEVSGTTDSTTSSSIEASSSSSSTSTSSTSTSTSSTTTSTSTSTSTTVPQTSTSIANETSTTVPSTTTSIGELGSTSTSTPGSTIVSQGSTTTVGRQTLPFTGGNTGSVQFAMFSIAAGAALVLGTRRRKATRAHRA